MSTCYYVSGPADTLPFNSFTSPIVFSETYTHQFATKALSPLSIIHATLPLFRNRKAVGSPTESSPNIVRGASVILCVPAVARVGVLGSSSNSMANAAVVQGFNVLRREAAVDPMFQDTRLRFVTLDVGRFGDAEGRKKRKHMRTPSDVGVLSNTLLGIVSTSRRPRALDVVWNVWFGNHQSVGAGGMFSRLSSSCCSDLTFTHFSYDIYDCIKVADRHSRFLAVILSSYGRSARIIACNSGHTAADS